MPAPTREILLSRYHYDPLDRLVDSTSLEQSTLQRFYCKTRLSCEIQGAVQRTVVQHDDQLLAQQQREWGQVVATLLATDQQRSVFNALDANQPNPFAYSPYGHRPAENGLLSLLGFNGERPDPVTGHYHLGNGYRQFNPVLMRFNSPDSWSPFGKGGLNAYVYCAGDPVNRADPTGHNFFTVTKAINKFLSLIGKSRTPAKNTKKTQMLAKPITKTAMDSNGPHTTVTNQPSIPSYDEALLAARKAPTSPPDYPLPIKDSEFENFLSSREPPPSYFEYPPPDYVNRRVSRLARPTGPPPPVPIRPPETLSRSTIIREVRNT